MTPPPLGDVFYFERQADGRFKIQNFIDRDIEKPELDLLRLDPDDDPAREGAFPVAEGKNVAILDRIDRLYGSLVAVWEPRSDEEQLVMGLDDDVYHYREWAKKMQPAAEASA